MHLLQPSAAAGVFANSFPFPAEYVLFMDVKAAHRAQASLALALLSDSRKKQGPAADHLLPSEGLYMLILVMRVGMAQHSSHTRQGRERLVYLAFCFEFQLKKLSFNKKKKLRIT